MKFSRTQLIAAGTIAACVLWICSHRTRAVHTAAVNVQLGRLTCDVVNPHDYPVEVQVAASFITPGTEYKSSKCVFEASSTVKIHSQSSTKVEFPLPDLPSGLYPQVLVESVERLSDVEM